MIKSKYSAVITDKTFSPLDISSMIIWYDFSDDLTLFTDAGTTKVSADGQAIYQVNDKSGNNYHLTQTTENFRPLYKINILNGKSVARLDGSDDWMVTSFTYKTQPNTIFSVWKANNAEGDVCYIYDGNSNYRQALLSSAGATPDSYYIYADVPNNSTGIFPKNRFVVVCVLFYGTSSAIWENASLVGEPSTGSQLFHGCTLGARTTTHAAPLDGDFCELIAYNKALTDMEREDVFAYLNAKWAIY